MGCDSPSVSNVMNNSQYVRRRAHRTHTPRRVLNDPREREALGKTTEAGRGGLPPVHAAMRFDAGQMAMKLRNVNRILRGAVIFGQRSPPATATIMLARSASLNGLASRGTSSGAPSGSSA